MYSVGFSAELLYPQRTRVKSHMPPRPPLQSMFHSCCFVLIPVMRETVSSESRDLCQDSMFLFVCQRYEFCCQGHMTSISTLLCVFGKVNSRDLICLQAVRIRVDVVQLSINAVWYLH